MEDARHEYYPIILKYTLLQTLDEMLDARCKMQDSPLLIYGYMSR